MFGGDIGGSSLTSEHDCSGYNIFPLFGCHLLDTEIPIDHIKYVHELSFVLMNTFDVDIKQRVLIDCYFTIMVDPLG